MFIPFRFIQIRRFVSANQSSRHSQSVAVVLSRGKNPHNFILYSAVFLNYDATGAYMNMFRGIMRNKKTPADLSTFESMKIQKAADELKEIDESYSKCNGIEIRELTIIQVQKLFATKKLTSVQLTDCYLARIHRMNPLLNAVIQVNPDAIKQAYEADAKFSEAGELYSEENHSKNSLMLGIPILLKDNIDTDDYMLTTAGSPALLGLRPKKDADVVKALRKAGAVILGKANLSEFAHFRGTNVPSGWSGRGGQTMNAYNLRVDPQGSSSGSAVAVSANLAMVSLGTETDASLLAPASVAGLFTIKCTLGKPSTKGVIPISHNQDNVGPLTRSAMDMTILLDAMNPPENRVHSKSSKCKKGYMGCLSERRIKQKKMRIGIVRFPFWDNSFLNSTDFENELPILEDNLNVLKSSKHFEIVDPVAYPFDLLTKITGEKELIVLIHDFKHEINAYLKNNVISVEQPRKIYNLADIIKYNDEHPNPEGYNQDILILSQETDGILNRTYVEAKKSNRLAAKELLNYFMDTYKLDAVMMPSVPWSDNVCESGLYDIPNRGWSLAAIAGYPSINVPAGIDRNGVPFGVTVIGKSHSEVDLLRIAQLMEEITPRRQLPSFLSSV